MKYERIVVDDESIDAVIRSAKAGAGEGAGLWLAHSVYLMNLSGQVQARRRIVALGGASVGQGLEEFDQGTVVQLQVAAEESRRFKRENYPRLAPEWEVMAVDNVSSARVVATLAEESSQCGETLVVAADGRLLSFLGDWVDVLLQGEADDGARLWTKGGFVESFGFSPKLYPVYRTLVCADLQGRPPYLSHDRTVELLYAYPNILEILNAYICHDVILQDNLRSRIRSMSAHLMQNMERSLIRPCPKLLGLWQAVSTEIKFDEDERQE